MEENQSSNSLATRRPVQPRETGVHNFPTATRILGLPKCHFCKNQAANFKLLSWWWKYASLGSKVQWNKKNSTVYHPLWWTSVSSTAGEALTQRTKHRDWHEANEAQHGSSKRNWGRGVIYLANSKRLVNPTFVCHLSQILELFIKQTIFFMPNMWKQSRWHDMSTSWALPYHLTILRC